MSDQTISGGTGFVPSDSNGSAYGNAGTNAGTNAGQGVGQGVMDPPDEPVDDQLVEAGGPGLAPGDPAPTYSSARTVPPRVAPVGVPRRYVPSPPTSVRPNDRPVADISHPVIAPPEDEEEEKKKEKENRPFYKKPKYIVGAVALLLLAVGLAVGIPWYLNARQYQSTDDAIIDAHSEKVAPQVSGRVLSVPVDDNQAVSAGQLLVQIDPRDYQARVDQAAASVAQAKGMLAQAEAQKSVNLANVAQAQAQVDVNRTKADNAKNDLDRYQKLSKEAVSRQTLDNATSSYRSAAANLTAALTQVTAAEAQVKLAESMIEADAASVKSAEAQLEQARLQLSYCTVVSKSAGTVTRKSVAVGDYVSAAQQVMAVVPQDVYVTANFKETELTDMRVGQSVTVHVDAYPDQKFTGKVQSIQQGTGAHFSLLPPENATGNYVKVVQRVPVKITFDDTTSAAYKRLSPGMSVEPSVKVE